MLSHARVLLLLLAATGCGGTDPAAPAPPPPPPPPPAVLSFAEITGTWEGTVTELRTPLVYKVSIEIGASAPKGSAGATVIYYLTEMGFSSDCDGILLANAAEARVYTFDEQISRGPCVNNGMVVLTYDPTSGKLTYEGIGPTGNKCCDAVLTKQ